MEIVDDLVAEHQRLEGILTALDDEAWASPSGAPGWTVRDVVVHLAQTDEWVVTTVGEAAEGAWRDGPHTVDEMVEAQVRAEDAPAAEVLARWRAAWRASVAALRTADPARRLSWAAAPLRPATLATTRLAEHWAHGLDITGALGIEFPDTDRLRHVAWLGHATLPYAFSLEGEAPQPVFCELVGPRGDVWRYGPRDADSTVTGPAGAFCRVGARRLTPDDSGLVATGPYAAAALRVLRNYAY